MLIFSTESISVVSRINGAIKIWKIIINCTVHNFDRSPLKFGLNENFRKLF